MERISENLRTISLDGLTQTDTLANDVFELCKLNNRDPAQCIPTMALYLGLRIKLGDPFSVHVLTDSVCQKVQGVKIESLPTDYPKFLKEPFLIEAKPGNVLFDDIDTIGGFIDKKEFYLLIWSKGTTYFIMKENPFNGVRIDQLQFVPKPGSYIPPPDKNKNVFPFITTLALMLEAEKTPVKIDRGTKKAKKRQQSKDKKAYLSDWIEYRVYIDAKLTYNSDNTAKDSIPLNKEGLERKKVKVNSFLRHQAHGPGHSLRKWIYVEEHETTKYKRTGDKKITVDAYFKDKNQQENQ